MLSSFFFFFLLFVLWFFSVRHSNIRSNIHWVNAIHITCTFRWMGTVLILAWFRIINIPIGWHTQRLIRFQCVISRGICRIWIERKTKGNITRISHKWMWCFCIVWFAAVQFLPHAILGVCFWNVKQIRRYTIAELEFLEGDFGRHRR